MLNRLSSRMVSSTSSSESRPRSSRKRRAGASCRLRRYQSWRRRARSPPHLRANRVHGNPGALVLLPAELLVVATTVRLARDGGFGQLKQVVELATELIPVFALV